MPAPSIVSVTTVRRGEPSRPAIRIAAPTAPAPNAPMISPAHVSGCPNACANAGASVFTGSEAKPAARTTNSSTSSRGLRRTSTRLSRRLACRWRRCGRGCTSSSVPMKSMYDTELTRNATGIPNAATVAAAAAGPAARAMLNVIELSAIADARSRAGTSALTIACCAGAENAANNAESAREDDHDPRLLDAAERERAERRAQYDCDGLRHEQQVLAVEAVGRRAGPRREDEHGDELREAEHAEQERRVRQPEDEERRREVLEPRAARRERVPEEVRAEVAVRDESERLARAA